METFSPPKATEELQRATEPFLRYLVDWHARLQTMPLETLVEEADGPDGIAVFAIDVTMAFFKNGALASPRIGALIPAIITLFERAHALGITRFVLSQDAHPEDSPEFDAYGPHSIAGSEEAQTIPELLALPFADQFDRIPKRSLNPAIASEMESWLASHAEATHHVVVGDCTDLCVYQMAMHLKMRANALGIRCQVVVPENCVQTYDVPPDIARATGTLPHDGDLLHLIFLYHMALNGIHIVKALY